MKIKQALDWTQYVIAILALASILIWIIGGFVVAYSFQRSIFDWSFVWRPELFDNLFLLLIFLLSIKRNRIAIILSLLYFLKDADINYQILFGSGFLLPDFLTYLGEIFIFYSCL